MKSKMSLLEKSLIAAKELNKKYEEEIEMKKGKIVTYNQ